MSTIEISNYEAVNKGALVARCDVKLIPWKMIIHDVKVFEKGANRWIGMPSRVTEKDGETKYFEQVQWTDKATSERFRSQVMLAIDSYLQENPADAAVVNADDDFPF